jgi:hypothetical protein
MPLVRGNPKGKAAKSRYCVVAHLAQASSMACGARLECGFLLPCGHYEKIVNRL